MQKKGIGIFISFILIMNVVNSSIYYVNSVESLSKEYIDNLKRDNNIIEAEYLNLIYNIVSYDFNDLNNLVGSYYESPFQRKLIRGELNIINIYNQLYSLLKGSNFFDKFGTDNNLKNNDVLISFNNSDIVDIINNLLISEIPSNSFDDVDESIYFDYRDFLIINKIFEIIELVFNDNLLESYNLIIDESPNKYINDNVINYYNNYPNIENNAFELKSFLYDLANINDEKEWISLNCVMNRDYFNKDLKNYIDGLENLLYDFKFIINLENEKYKEKNYLSFYDIIFNIISMESINNFNFIEDFFYSNNIFQSNENVLELKIKIDNTIIFSFEEFVNLIYNAIKNKKAVTLKIHYDFLYDLSNHGYYYSIPINTNFKFFFDFEKLYYESFNIIDLDLKIKPAIIDALNELIMFLTIDSFDGVYNSLFKISDNINIMNIENNRDLIINLSFGEYLSFTAEYPNFMAPIYINLIIIIILETILTYL